MTIGENIHYFLKIRRHCIFTTLYLCGTEQTVKTLYQVHGGVPSAQVASCWSWSSMSLALFLPWLHPGELANSSWGVLCVAGR